METRTTHILIIGGGAAGMCAAIGARQQLRQQGFVDTAVRITLLERNERLGIKIRISGGGKCNITHSGKVSSVLEKGFWRLTERRFLKPAFYAFTNQDILNWLHTHGVETYTRPNGRIFPVSGKATDVLMVFETLLAQHQIEIVTNARALKVEQRESLFLVDLADCRFQASVLILATGGVSYSKTGTTGDGLRFAQALGHTIVPPRAALAPIYFTTPPPNALVGISLRNVKLIAKSAQQMFSRTDDVLITHRGLSGPACLSISRDVAEALEHSPVELFVDFFPTLSEEALEAQLIAAQQHHPLQSVRTFLEAPLPNALVPFVLQAAHIPLDQKWHHFSKGQRKALLRVLKAYPLGAVQEVPLDRGEVSAGGVALTEVDPKTMASKRVPNLFIAGETLDIAGEVGGFNLQAAYSTGWLAGRSAAQALRWD